MNFNMTNISYVIAKLENGIWYYLNFANNDPKWVTSLLNAVYFLSEAEIGDILNQNCQKNDELRKILQDNQCVILSIVTAAKSFEPLKIDTSSIVDKKDAAND